MGKVAISGIPGFATGRKESTMTQTNTNATINVDALLAAGVINPFAARKLAAKIEWYSNEVDCYDLHTNGEPQKRLAELEDEKLYIHQSANACKQALLELNRSYKEATGRYIVRGMIRDFNNLVEILDDIVGM